MRDPLTYAHPIREGVYVRDGNEEIVWQDHLWNTGDVTRSWFIAPGVVGNSKIKERDIGHTNTGQ